MERYPLVFCLFLGIIAAANTQAITNPEPPLVAPEKSQVVILPGAHLSITLPESWDPNPDIQQNQQLTLYQFRRYSYPDNRGRPIIPNFAIFVEVIPEEFDTLAYSMQKQSQAPFEVIDILSAKNGIFGEVNGIGYISAYQDDLGLRHKVYIIHIVIDGLGIQVIIDSTSYVFDKLDQEFRTILRSIKLLK